MTKCIIYARFSPRPDADESESAEKQIESCRAYASRKGYEVVAEYADKGKSRNDIHREGLIRAIDAVGRGDILLCYEISRFGAGHGAVTLEQEVLKNGGKLEFVQGLSVADSPDTKMLRAIMFAFKEYEREMIGIRTSIAMKRMQSDGQCVSGIPPYGYRKDDSDPNITKLVPDPIEFPVLQEMISMYQGGNNLSQIARAVTRHGPEAMRGNAWHATTVRRSLIRTGNYKKKNT